MSTRIEKTKRLMRKQPGQARSRATVEAIVQAAARILGDQSWAGFTTNKVADTAGVSIDGAGWHQQGDKLRVPGNITLLSLPPYSPELNPMENVWAYLR